MKYKKEKRNVALTVRLPFSVVQSLKDLSVHSKSSQSGIIETALKLLDKKKKVKRGKNEVSL